MTPAALYWLFALAITVHNIEEGLFLPTYTADKPRLAGRITPFALRFALVILTAALYAVVALAAAGYHLAIDLLAGVAAVMVINALVPHLTLIMVFRRYAPGTGTAIFLVVPLALLIIVNGLAEMLTVRSLLVATAAVGITLLVAIPLLFWVGHYAERRLPGLSANGAV